MTEPDPELVAALDGIAGWRAGTDGRTAYRDGAPGWLRTVNRIGASRWMGRVWHATGDVMDVCEIETFDTARDAVAWCDLWGETFEAAYGEGPSELPVRDGHPKTDGPW